MIVLRLRRGPPKPSVMFPQILALQIHVGVLMTTNLLPSQFLHQPILMRAVNPLPPPPLRPRFLPQPILMRAVNPLHPPLGLWRTGRYQFDPQLRAHASKLGDRLFSAQPLARIGRSLV